MDERIDRDGEIQKPLDRVDARQAIERLLAEDVEAIAICLINSYVNPVHEQLLFEVMQEVAPDLPCCISYNVLPEIKEYERTSTTVINAYLLPVIASYLNSLVAKLQDEGVQAPLLLMQSNGGLTTVDQTAVGELLHCGELVTHRFTQRIVVGAAVGVPVSVFRENDFSIVYFFLK